MIELKTVSKWYHDFRVLDQCSARIEKGEVVVVCGPSGSGKSTLIKTINGLEPFQEGEILVDSISVGAPSTNLPKLRSRIGMVFQSFELFPHMSVLKNITVAQVKVLGRQETDAQQRALKYLERVGLMDHKDKFPGQLSGGQQQRVAIARAVVKNPDILLCDEPTGALDFTTGIQVLKLLQEFHHRHGKTVVIITHNAGIAAIADRVFHMRDGQIVQVDVNETPLSPDEVTW